VLHDHRARRAGILAGLACLAVSLSPAAIASAATPAPCGGEPLVIDKSGDQVTDPGGTGLFEDEGAPNTDILQGFFTYEDVAGKKVLTANTVIRDLKTGEIPGAATALYYYTLFVVGGETKYVVYRDTGGAPVFKYGTYDPDLGTYLNEGDTTGALVPGANGVVSVVVPEALGIKEGTELKTVAFTVDEIYGGDDETGLNVHADEAPAEGGPSYIVAPCAAGTTPAPAPTPAPGTTPTPTPTPSSGPATLPFRAALYIGSAKKAKAKATLKFQVKAEAPISGLKLTLKASNGKGPVLASLTVKSLKKGVTTIKLKLKKKLKKGKYLLSASGKVDGKTLKAAQQVGVR